MSGPGGHRRRGAELAAQATEDWAGADLDLAAALLGVSLDAILAHELPPEVRLPDGMVEMRGLEPLTPAMRTRCSPS